jgi:hypothetical protein
LGAEVAMTLRRPPWVVLIPGDADDVRRRVRLYYEQQGLEPTYTFRRGTDRYHGVFGLEIITVGQELQLGEELSADSDEPIYATDLTGDPTEGYSPMAFRRGKLDVEEGDPDELAQELGCPIPDLGEWWLPVAFSATRIEGLSVDELEEELEEQWGWPPGFGVRECAGGVLVYGRPGPPDPERAILATSTLPERWRATVAASKLSERLPDLRLYHVVASAGMSDFVVTIEQGGEEIGHYHLPPRTDPSLKPVADVLGETDPSRILAALDIPWDLFTKK